MPTPTTVSVEESLGKLIDQATPFATEHREPDPLAETWNELQMVRAETSADIGALAGGIAKRATEWDRQGNGAERDNAALLSARRDLHDIAEACRGLTRRIDLAAKLAGRAIDIANKELEAGSSDRWPRTEINRSRKALENARLLVDTR